MKQYEITFCAQSVNNKRMFIARALAEGNDAYEALKNKYPEIKPGEWLAIQAYSSLDLSTAIEFPCPKDKWRGE
jgi:hypothetical protein